MKTTLKRSFFKVKMLLHGKMENANKSALYVDRISKAVYTECSVLKSTYRKQPFVQATHPFTKSNKLVTFKDELLKFKLRPVLIRGDNVLQREAKA